MKKIPAGPNPAPLSFRSAHYKADSGRCEIREPWFKLGYALRGVMEAHVEGHQLLCPPRFATWIPANALHACYNRQNCEFVSVYIESSLCKKMPQEACTLILSPLIKAILADFAARNITVPESEQDHRLITVLMDQLAIAPREISYLPTSSDKGLQMILDALQARPSDRRSLSDWAQQLDITERTLSRRFQRELGLSFNDWRQRLKFVTALSMLEDKLSINEIAKQLGYNSASAFISMFKRLSGMSPLQLHPKNESSSTGNSDKNETIQ